MFRLVVLPCLDLCRSNSFHANTQLGLGHYLCFNYPGPFLNIELELACLSGKVRLVSLALYCLDSAPPSGLPCSSVGKQSTLLSVLHGFKSHFATLLSFSVENMFRLVVLPCFDLYKNEKTF